MKTESLILYAHRGRPNTGSNYTEVRCGEFTVFVRVEECSTEDLSEALDAGFPKPDEIVLNTIRVPLPQSSGESEFVDGLIREGEKRQGIKHSPPASTPANPPKEGRASPESEKV